MGTLITVLPESDNSSPSSSFTGGCGTTSGGGPSSGGEPAGPYNNYKLRHILHIQFDARPVEQKIGKFQVW